MICLFHQTHPEHFLEDSIHAVGDDSRQPVDESYGSHQLCVNVAFEVRLGSKESVCQTEMCVSPYSTTVHRTFVTEVYT